MKRIENKVAYITGGNSGMGLATAERFLEEGAKVIVTGKRKEAINEYNSKANNNTLAILADVNNHSSVKESLELNPRLIKNMYEIIEMETRIHVNYLFFFFLLIKI